MGTIPEEKVVFYRVARKDLVLLKFFLEAYEGMSTMSTVDRVAGIVRISIPAGFVSDMESLLAELSGTLSLQQTPYPLPADTADCLVAAH
jgi:hypothetical protein